MTFRFKCYVCWKSCYSTSIEQEAYWMLADKSSVKDAQKDSSSSFESYRLSSHLNGMDWIIETDPFHRNTMSQFNRSQTFCPLRRTIIWIFSNLSLSIYYFAEYLFMFLHVHWNFTVPSLQKAFKTNKNLPPTVIPSLWRWKIIVDNSLTKYFNALSE